MTRSGPWDSCPPPNLIPRWAIPMSVAPVVLLHRRCLLFLELSLDRRNRKSSRVVETDLGNAIRMHSRYLHFLRELPRLEFCCIHLVFGSCHERKRDQSGRSTCLSDPMQ